MRDSEDQNAFRIDVVDQGVWQLSEPPFSPALRADRCAAAGRGREENSCFGRFFEQRVRHVEIRIDLTINRTVQVFT